MADNVAITAGAGTSIATDDVGGVHYQVVKLAVGDGSSTAVSASAPFPTQRGNVSAKHFVAAASDNATSVKASAGTLRGFHLYNDAQYPVYLKFHNTAGSPTAGSGVVRTFGIQAGTSVDFTFPGGLAFATGIAFTLVTDMADAGTTATAAEDAVGEIFYE
jgi:hypothetical protein